MHALTERKLLIAVEDHVDHPIPKHWVMIINKLLVLLSPTYTNEGSGTLTYSFYDYLK